MDTKRLLASLLFASLLPACPSVPPGRLDCPEGETCSDATPSGLHFDGARIRSHAFDFGAADARATAVGGVQTYDISRGLEPLELEWTADSRGALAVDHVGASSAAVRGVSAGTSLLRIVDPETGELYDRTEIAAAPIASVGIVAVDEILLPGAGRLAIAAGARPVVGIALEDADGERLIDEALTVDATGASLERRGWDSVSVRADAAGPVALSIKAGDLAPQRIELEAVDGIDAIVPGLSSPILSDQPLVAGGQALICFEGRRGDATVLGLGWTFAADADGLSTAPELLPNCAAFEPTAPGHVTITASAGGKSTQLAVDVLPAPPGSAL